MWCETGVTSAVESSYQQQRFLERGRVSLTICTLLRAPTSHQTLRSQQNLGCQVRALPRAGRERVWQAARQGG